MVWNFSISWVPGTVIPAPDETSSRQQETDGAVDNFMVTLAALQLDEVLREDLAGDVGFAAFGKLKASEIAAVTWERVKEERWHDKTMVVVDLVDAIGKGFNRAMVERLPQGLAEFWRHRDRLHVAPSLNPSIE